jgi:multisubunit Na+/H+ antiporter MnhF subunit
MIAPLLGYSVIGILYDIIIGPNLSAQILRTDAINYASIFVRASLYSCRSPVCREAAAIGRIGKQAAIF